MQIPRPTSDNSARLLPGARHSIIAHTVAGGGWLLLFGAAAPVWIPSVSMPDLPEAELHQIACLGRTLLLSGAERQARLAPAHIRWLLESPLRVACLIDFLAVGEDPRRLRSAPLYLTFATTGSVTWSFEATSASTADVSTTRVTVVERRSFSPRRAPARGALATTGMELHAS